MSNMREILDLINEMSEEEGSIELMDSFDIELGEDLLVETGVIDFMEDGIVLEGDDRMLELLSEHGLVLEETDWSKYDEPTISRIKKGVTKPVDKTDYDKPAYQRKKEKEEKKLDEKMIMGMPGDQGSKVMGEEEVDEAEYQGRKVPLGKPMAGDVKKSKVYVKGPKGNVVKVNFGDKNMRIKKNIPGRRKNFRARHNCDNPGPRWKARYWSCRAW
jgi:hypothetical protein